MENYLSILVDNDNDILIDKYQDDSKNYLNDCGFDIYTPKTVVVPANSISFKINFQISTKMEYQNKNVGFMMVPRSSMGSKSPLRLSNSIGIVDLAYRGNLMAIVDNISDSDFEVKQGSRIIQLVAFNGMPIRGKVVKELGKTDRGEGGFGSTGI